MSVPALNRVVREIMVNNAADGVTVSGGDPLEQPDELLDFLEGINEIATDILIYTGYTLAELTSLWPASRLDALKNHAAVLIDGRYIDGQNDGRSPLTGSSNQRIHYFDESLRPRYEEYMRTHGRVVQNYYYGNNLVSVGIPQQVTVNSEQLVGSRQL